MRTLLFRFRYCLGSFDNFRKIDWASVDRVVFVCKGNVCRSAYAEAVARSLGVDSVSCGVDTRSNFPADDDAIATAEASGIDLSNHRTLPIQSLELRENDLFVAMEPWQAEFIVNEYGDAGRCSLLGLWGNPVYPHIQDPHGASKAYFDKCFSYIEKSVHEIARKIKETG